MEGFHDIRLCRECSPLKGLQYSESGQHRGTVGSPVPVWETHTHAVAASVACGSEQATVPTDLNDPSTSRFSMGSLIQYTFWRNPTYPSHKL